MEDQELESSGSDKQSSYRIISSYFNELNIQYRPLIYSKWLRSLRFGNDYFRLIESGTYYKNYQRYIEHVLYRPNTIIKLAVLTEAPEVVLAFSVVEVYALHYVHVHRYNRRIGIGKSLFPKDFKYVTHITKDWISMWPKYKEVKFDPFI